MMMQEPTAKKLFNALNQSKSPEEFHRSVLSALLQPMGAHTACIKLMRNGRVVSEFSMGNRQGALNNAYSTLEGPILRQVKAGKPFHLARYDYLDDTQAGNSQMGLAVHPLRIGDELLGVLILGSDVGVSPGSKDEDSMETPSMLTDVLALCIDGFHRAQLNAEARERLAAVEKLRLSFITSISHALRTPLTTIKGLLATFMDPTAQLDDETSNRHIGVLAEQVDKLSQFVEDLTNLMEIERGQQIELNIKTVDVAELVRNMSAMKSQVSDKYDYVVEPESGALKITADEEKLSRILAKILDNAEKYSSRGGKILLECQESENSITISVQDWGDGMAEEEVSSVFSKFYRPPEESGPDRGGVGISLYLVKKYVEAHGGIIWIDSHKEQGTKVTITLPKTQSDDAV